MEEAALLPVMRDRNNDDVISVSDNESDITLELSSPKKKSKNYDVESICMGEELSDLTINHAQKILKLQFKELNGFHSTLSQGTVAQWSQNEVRKRSKFSAWHHWIVASTVNCRVVR